MNSQTFLEELYPDKPDDTFILLWKNKRSKWFVKIDEAAGYINRIKKDIYYGVGLSPKNFGTGKRCKANQIAGIPGLYVDIDVGEGSKKYPPTIDDAIGLVSGNGFEPTMIVGSGYGLHAYWLFKEIWIFDSDSERNYAADLNRRINYFIKQRATKQGWNIDNVSDLARILRPAGSLNCKKDPKLVEVIVNEGPRYSDPDVFDKLLPAPDEYTIQPHSDVSAKELAKIEEIIKLKSTAEPPQEKLDMLLEADATFKSLWQRIKSKKKDTSNSGFHMSLANIAAKAKWTDQEITNLLIAWNRRHQIDLDKIMKRGDYVAMTIARARKNASEFFAEEYTEELDILSGTEYQDALHDSSKKKAIEIISYHLGFKIFKIINYKQEKKNKYVMESAEGDIIFIGTDEIHMKSKFERRIMAATNRSVSLSRKNFDVVKSMYKPIIVDVTVSRESTVEGRMKEWLTEYLSGKPHLNQHDAVTGSKPFVHKGQWHVFHTSFREWAYRNRHDSDTIEKTEFDLKYIGGEERKLNPRKPMSEQEDKLRTTIRPWAIPLDVISPEEK